MNKGHVHFEYFKPICAQTVPHRETFLTTGWCTCCHGIFRLTAEASGYALLESEKVSYGMANQHHTSPWDTRHQVLSPVHQLEEEQPLCSEKSGKVLEKKTLVSRTTTIQQFGVTHTGSSRESHYLHKESTCNHE